MLGHQAKDQSLQNCATWDLGSEELADTFAELYPELSQSFTADESKLGTNSEGVFTLNCVFLLFLNLCDVLHDTCFHHYDPMLLSLFPLLGAHYFTMECKE